MGLIIILGLLIWGWAEMSAFIYIGSEIGGLLTLLGVFVTAIFGIALLKRQGLSVLSRIQADLAKGRAPVTSIADSISMVVGGALMLIPGYVTDGIGLLLFIPGIRTLAGVYLLQWMARSKRFTGFTNFGGASFGNAHQAIRHRVPLATSITPLPSSSIKQGMMMISSKVNLKNGRIKITRLVTKKVASPKPQILNQNPEHMS